MAALGQATTGGGNFASNLCDLVFRSTNSTNWTQPPSLWVGLCTASPSATATGECSIASNYNRVQITWGTASNGSASGPSASCVWTSASGSWGDVKGYIICAASTGSTGASQYIAFGNLNPSVAVTTNDTVSFAANAMTMTFA